MAIGAAAQAPLTVDAAVQAAIAHNASLRAVRAGLDEARCPMMSFLRKLGVREMA